VNIEMKINVSTVLDKEDRGQWSEDRGQMAKTGR
jgi:hypothetical protein